MGRPWIKDGKINTSSVHELFERVRFDSDAIKFEDWIVMIAARINDAEEATQVAQNKVKEYEEKINADSRVKEIKARYDEATEALYRGFGISQGESEKIAAWKDKHDVKQHRLNSLDKKMRANGSIGGRYYYQFIPTSIGTICTCICGSCERKAFVEAKGDREKYKKLKKKYDAEFDFSELQEETQFLLLIFKKIMI